MRRSMNRRNLLKGLAVIPMARLAAAQTITACNDGSTCSYAPKSLLVWLEGPFAVVLQRDRSGKTITGIVAFSPIDTDHRITVNKSPLGKYPFQHHFKLNGPGLNSRTSACISADFNDFCAQNLGMVGNVDNASFIRINLPCPKNIFTNKLLKGTVGPSGTPRDVCIPQDHVLEYEIINADKPSTLT